MSNRWTNFGERTESNLSHAENLFLRALELPADRREEWLRAQCGGDDTAFRETMTLLRAHDGIQDGFLETSALDFRGRQFGAYRATELIGRGGMSVVYRGERADGGFQKQVAIKIGLTPATTTPQRGETQILAGLEHPNIARLIDAGVGDFGFPYLLMEYVEGRTITSFAAGMGEVHKLRLFLQVCAGVQSAHQSLVVHRDLKPDNVMVTADGTVKLLDFGIAKALTPDHTGTQTTGIKAFTADYASPEQILGKPVTTAADIYSLGALLCTICGGRPPRSLAGLELGELVERVQSEEVRELPLKGDLALIAAKALRRDPRERYESASALARDVERYLTKEPIEARAPSWTYRASRFASRHRYAVPAAAAVAIALAVTTGVALRQAALARTRFDDVRGLARTVMFDLHDAVAPLNGSLEARKLIVDQSLAYLDKLGSDKSAGADIQMDLARGYLRLSGILGGESGSGGFGHPKDAAVRGMQAVEAARRAVAADGRSTTAKVLLIETLGAAAVSHEATGELAKGIAVCREAVKAARELPATPEHLEVLALALRRLGAALEPTSKAKDRQAPVLDLFRESLLIRRRLFEADPANAERKFRLAEAYHYLGGAYHNFVDMPNAATYLREALRIDEGRLRTDPKAAEDVASDAYLLGMTEINLGQPDAGIQLLERSLAIRRAHRDAQPRSLDLALYAARLSGRLAWAHMKLHRYTEATRLGEQTVREIGDIYLAHPENQHAGFEFFAALVNLARAREKSGSGDRCAPAREALRFAEVHPRRHPDFLKDASRIADSCR